ncbi:MAG: TonB-dependent receptor [Candidatus Paracaedibacteraceae bacterium]|nr:TonB-dependent receptor [Candidatus Paracaedibacteraceae bacterium]
MKFLLPLLASVQAEQVAPTVHVKAKAIRQMPSSIHQDVLTSQTIKRRQYSTLDSVLNSFPGTVIVRSGNIGQPSSVFVRGTNSNHLQVRLDGMRINSPDAANGSLDTSLIGTENLATISILRGGQGSLYGPDAVGGVLLLTTPKAESSQEDLQVEFSSNRVAKISGSAQHRYDTLGVYLGADGVRSSGNHQTPVTYRQPSGHYPRLYFRQNGFVGRLDHQLNDRSHLMLVSRYNQADALIQLFDRASPQERENFLHRGQLSVQPTLNWTHLFGVGFFQSRQNNAIRDRFQSQTMGQRTQFDWTQTYQSRAFGDFSLMLEGSQDRVKQNDARSSFAFLQNSFGMGCLWQKKGSWVDWDISLRHDKTASFGATVTHREGFVLKPWSGGKLIASYGTGFKAPTLYQLYAKTPYYSGNPDLKTEHSQQWDVGFDQVLGRCFRWQETYFMNRLTRLIYPTVDFQSNTNLGRARIKGLESGVSWFFGGWIVSFNHTLMRAENLQDRTRLLRRPRTKLAGIVSYELDDWLSSLEIIRQGHRPDIHPTNFRKITAKPYTVLHLKIQKKLTSGTRYFGRIENVLNRKIQEPMGYKQSGLAVYCGMEMRFV